MFMALQSLQHFYTNVCFWSREVLPSVDEPLEGAYEEDDAESNDAVVYVCQPCPRILSDDTYSCSRQSRGVLAERRKGQS
jgi:hypothetical protein